MMKIGLFLEHTPYNWTRLLCCNLVITLASSMKSSSDMVPSFIIFTATSVVPLYLPLRTTPNWPEPSSSNRVNSVGSISHFPWARPINRHLHYETWNDLKSQCGKVMNYLSQWKNFVKTTSVIKNATFTKFLSKKCKSKI